MQFLFPEGSFKSKEGHSEIYLKTYKKGINAYLLEAIGTFFLVLVFGFTGDALAIGLSLMALIYIGFEGSGAHYNPAVSFGFLLKRKLSLAEFSGYFISQVLGGILAASVLLFLSGSVFYVEPPASTNLYQQAFAEVFFVFIFVLVMLIFSLSNDHRRTKLIGLVAGLTFAGLILAATSISGGVLNPAISLGTAIVDLINGGGSYMDILLYSIAPLTGGALAAFAFNFFHFELEG